MAHLIIACAALFVGACGAFLREVYSTVAGLLAAALCFGWLEIQAHFSGWLH